MVGSSRFAIALSAIASVACSSSPVDTLDDASTARTSQAVGLETATWTKSTWPSGARVAASLAYDPIRKRTIAVGGAQNNNTFYTDVFEFDGTDWGWGSSGGMPILAHAPATFDTERAAVIIFGGFSWYSYTISYSSTLYEYNGTVWVSRAPTPRPAARIGHGFTYDLARKVAVAFGGHVAAASPPVNDTWEWDGFAWKERTPAASPTPRQFFGMTYDPVRKRTVLWGGDDNAGKLFDETWEYDGTTWTKASPLVSPPARTGVTLAFHGGLKKVVMIGGSTQVWVYDGVTWAQLATTGLTLRAQAPMAYDSARDEMIIVGGDAKGIVLTYESTVDMTAEGDALHWKVSRCTTSSDCTGGFCAGGVCCSTACTGACQTCASSVGTCTIVPKGGQPSDGSCKRLCDGVAAGCPSATCATDADCASGSYCDGAGACAPRKPLGGVCTEARQCASSICVDGFCCDRACLGQCEACDVAGKLGTCSGVAGAPHGVRTACGGSGVCAGACDGTSPSCSYPAATTTCAPAACAGGNAVPAATCDGTGSCAAPAPVKCAPYGCGGTACKTSCTTNADCALTATCSSGACVGRRANGMACADASECTSGYCADGVCCDAGCDDACRSCAIPGKLGTCSVADDGPDPRKKCGGACTFDACKSGACAPRSATTACDSSCEGGKLTSGHCSGTDATCVEKKTVDCAGGLACESATACKTTCTTSADCLVGTCTGGVCVLESDAGVGDAGVDAPADVPVDVGPAPDAGLSATEPPKVSGEFQRCGLDSECASGFCVQGVCCNERCDRKCFSCNLITSPGVCVPEPYGVDLRNECGPPGTCIGTCSGGGTCIGAGPDTLCGRNRCTDATRGVGPAFCAAAGDKCPVEAATPFDCAPYACDVAFGACRTTCVTSNDCGPGHVCDLASKSCTVAHVPEDDGGCAVGGRGSRRSREEGWLGLAAVVWALARSRVSGRRSAPR
ncbi:MAG: hypothetical protein HYV09_20595 [Deltaproteobacteria bacterium]|nr:hypothetical protein [Deltaproteobacteria bacterium]